MQLLSGRGWSRRYLDKHVVNEPHITKKDSHGKQSAILDHFKLF
jgi:hypothetical protein